MVVESRWFVSPQGNGPLAGGSHVTPPPAPNEAFERVNRHARSLSARVRSEVCHFFHFTQVPAL